MTVGIEFRDDDEVDDVYIHPKTKKEMNSSEATKYVEWQMRKDYFRYAISGKKDGKLIGIGQRLEHLRWSLSRWEIVNYLSDTKYFSVFLFGYGKTSVRKTSFDFDLTTPIISLHLRWKNAPEGYYE